MKIAIMSDFHFGYGAGTDLEQDSYESVEQALEMSLGCDLILMPGDLFDTRTPNTETLAKAMQLMIKPSLIDNGARFLRFINNGTDFSRKSLSGIPVITIHGTHERRTKELMNPVQALQTAGFAIHLHCNGIVFEKSGELVAIHGLSGVPDQYAEDVLRNWNPRPEPGCYNIFMLHQNIREFMPGQIEHAIRTEDLPEGFDLYICGHVHEAKKAKKGSKPFLFPGSLIPTQINKESTKPRGMFVVDTKSGSIEFLELEKQRKVFIIENDDKESIIKAMEEILSKENIKKPIVRIKLPQRAEGLQAEIRNTYGELAIVSFKTENEEQVIHAKSLEEHVMSVNELGKQLLEKNLKIMNLSPQLFESVFDLIAEGRDDEAESLILESVSRPKAAENIEKQPWNGNQ
jgi:DNA repair exonuclease SbcCD nuclease subunit